MDYDVAIIGGGVVGCAIARDLAQYDLRVVLLEAQNDVGKGTSKANTAILHTGFDAKPEYLESRLLRRGYALLKDYAAEAGIPVEPLGALLVAWDDAQRDALRGLYENAQANAVADVEIVSADEVYRREPNLGPGAQGGLWVPGESIICPFTTPLAFATQAVLNGVELRLNSPVQRVEVAAEDRSHTLHCPGQSLRASYVVNAAGLHSDTVDRMFGHEAFTVTPRRGQLLVFDKFSRSLLNQILLPVPSKHTKGVLISPTVFGNLMLGPTAEDLDDKAASQTTAAGIDSLLAQGRRILPGLLDEEVTASYAGLRAATEHGDYQIHVHDVQGYICVGGIRSTGLSASMGIAEYVVDRLAAMGLDLSPKSHFETVRMPNIGEASLRPYQDDALIAADSAYGHVMCFCERVTEGEIRDALTAQVPACDVDGLRRRSRAQMGRCQGFYCSAAIQSMLAEAQR